MKVIKGFIWVVVFLVWISYLSSGELIKEIRHLLGYSPLLFSIFLLKVALELEEVAAEPIESISIPSEKAENINDVDSSRVVDFQREHMDGVRWAPWLLFLASSPFVAEQIFGDGGSIGFKMVFFLQYAFGYTFTLALAFSVLLLVLFTEIDDDLLEDGVSKAYTFSRDVLRALLDRVGNFILNLWSFMKKNVFIWDIRRSEDSASEERITGKEEEVIEKEGSYDIEENGKKEVQDSFREESSSSVADGVEEFEFEDEVETVEFEENEEDLEALKEELQEALQEFGVKSTVVNYQAGPSVVMYEVKLDKGVRLNKLTNLSDDLAVKLAAGRIRIVAPLEGKDTVGIELPRKKRQTVLFKKLVSSKTFRRTPTPLPLLLGVDITGRVRIDDLRKMPHLLVAGTTGSGKSVFLHSVICGIMTKATPDVVKFILVDPKMVEFSLYEGSRYLLIPPVVDVRKASRALKWAVDEMEKRYELLTRYKVKDIEAYNAVAEEKMPYIVVVVDELADLMMVARNEVELSIARLSQKARAIGIHLVIATQRPSVDVLTGVIKANLPSRVAFSVSSATDSRVILDAKGAESLLGKGDMLYKPIGSNTPLRIQAPFLAEKEIIQITDKWRGDTQEALEMETVIFEGEKLEEFDPLLPEALVLVAKTGKASVANFQRLFKIGHTRAMYLMEQLEKVGAVGPFEDKKPRKVLVDLEGASRILSRLGIAEDKIEQLIDDVG